MPAACSLRAGRPARTNGSEDADIQGWVGTCRKGLGGWALAARPGGPVRLVSTAAWTAFAADLKHPSHSQEGAGSEQG